ncbi:hypothetical protein B0J12DRAFT_219036 [Macrophomina phaseolina]|uniref:Uncharacterized protein n=1 Tax=Macrophomina phaseolina TaxID=35725 RepID=A0ABQ8G3W8_9PEZI|nr:hypothetical protein B0J12DRAFT_219036 [Macrophomina phaseolina]
MVFMKPKGFVRSMAAAKPRCAQLSSRALRPWARRCTPSRQALAERYRIRGNVDIGSRRQVVSPSICGIPSRNGMGYASDPIEHVEDYRQGKGNAGQECWQAATARRLVSGNWGGKRFFFAVPTVRMAAACLPTYATTCSCGRVHPLACSAREPTCIPARCHLPDGQKITSACFLGRARFPCPCIKDPRGNKANSRRAAPRLGGMVDRHNHHP